jgi:diadenylate cyclase
MILLRLGFLNFTLIDLIDVIIVSYFFYKGLLFFKQTRSVHMIVGIIIIFGVGFLAYWFNLGMVKWLFSNIAIAGAIILAVLFQPELRGALSMLGRRRFLSFFINPEIKGATEAVMVAAQKLADMHYGALIVLERNVKLANVVESGKELNSHVSAELLQTIFTPYTPLHDGAVVIRGDQIIAANCTLPLSQNPAYHRLHGMRHKAGVGATEDSDAVVVIVSEETGQISYAFNGHLYRNVGAQELEGILSEIFNRDRH